MKIKMTEKTDYLKNWDAFIKKNPELEKRMEAYLQSDGLSIASDDLNQIMRDVNLLRSLAKSTQLQICTFALTKQNNKAENIEKDLLNVHLKSLEKPNVLIANLINIRIVHYMIEDLRKDPKHYKNFLKNVKKQLDTINIQQLYQSSARHDIIAFSHTALDSQKSIEDFFDRTSAYFMRVNSFKNDLRQKIVNDNYVIPQPPTGWMSTFQYGKKLRFMVLARLKDSHQRLIKEFAATQASLGVNL